MTPVKQLARHWPLLVMAGLMSLILLAATSGGFSAGRADSEGGYYQRLAGGFLSGHLYSSVDPPEGLLALSNPYDPAMSAPFRSYGVHDSILYRGHSYFYWAPGPVVLIIIPFRLVGITLTETDVGRFSLVLLPIIAGLFLVGLRRRTSLQMSTSMYLLLLLGLPFSALITSTRIAIWESGALFMGATALIAACGLVLQFLDRKPPQGAFQVVITPLCVFAAITTRPEAAILMLIPVIGMILRRKELTRNLTALVRESIGFVVGGIAVGAVMMYNQFRFGHLFDFATNRVVGGVDHSKLTFSSVSYILPNLYYYLIRPIGLQRTFPFINFKSFAWPYHVSDTYLTSEVVAGLVFTVPTVIFLILLWRRSNSIPKSTVSVLLGLCCLLLMFLSYTIFGATQRYRLFFDLLMLVAVAVAVAYAELKRCYQWALAVFAVVSTMISVAGLAHGYYPEQVPENAVIQTLRGITSAINKSPTADPTSIVAKIDNCIALSADTGSVTPAMESSDITNDSIAVLLPKIGFDLAQPLAVRGGAGSADVIGLVWNGRSAQILHDHWRLPPSISPAFNLKPGAYHYFNIRFDVERGVIQVFVDGVRMFSHATDLVANSTVMFGRNLIGAGTVAQELQTKWFNPAPSLGQPCVNEVFTQVDECLAKTLIRQDGSISTRRMSVSRAFQIDLVMPKSNELQPLFAFGPSTSADIFGLRVDGSTIEIVRDQWGRPPTNQSTLISNLKMHDALTFSIYLSKFAVVITVDKSVVYQSNVPLLDHNGLLLIETEIPNSTVISSAAGIHLNGHIPLRCS